jgi:GH15 family glucan-1,4-alpha-glucosidase
MYGNINPYWQAIADGFYFSDATKTKYTFKQTLGIVDSGWTALSGPSTEIKFIKDWITRNMVGVKVDANGYTSFSCASYYSTLPSVYIRLGGYWIQMLPEDYVIKLGTDSCTLLITVNEDFWALGMTVMRGYYVIFDIQNDQVGFVPQNDSKKTAIVQDVASSTSPTPLV